MKEELINKFLEKALQYLQTAEAFTAKEVPEYIRELLSFKMMEHIVDGVTAIIIGSIIGIIMGFLFLGGMKHDYNIEITVKKSLVVICFFTSVCLGGGIVKSADDFMQAYKAYRAPRVYLIDYFRKEVK